MIPKRSKKIVLPKNAAAAPLSATAGPNLTGWNPIDPNSSSFCGYQMQPGDTLLSLTLTYCNPPCCGGSGPTNIPCTKSLCPQIDALRKAILTLNPIEAIGEVAFNQLWNDYEIPGAHLKMPASACQIAAKLGAKTFNSTIATPGVVQTQLPPPPASAADLALSSAFQQGRHHVLLGGQPWVLYGNGGLKAGRDPNGLEVQASISQGDVYVYSGNKWVNLGLPLQPPALYRPVPFRRTNQ